MNYFLAIRALWRFSGGSVVAFNPLLRTIQFPWYTSLSIKTKKADSPIISINIGQNTTARIYVSLHYFKQVFFFTICIFLVGKWFHCLCCGQSKGNFW